MLKCKNLTLKFPASAIEDHDCGDRRCSDTGYRLIEAIRDYKLKERKGIKPQNQVPQCLEELQVLLAEMSQQVARAYDKGRAIEAGPVMTTTTAEKK